MELINKKSVLRGLAERWKNQYPKDATFFSGRTAFAIIQQLESEKELTEERANEIIGNKSWTTITCDECEEDVDAVVLLGQDPDFESSTATICFNCLSKAISLIQSEKNV